jgi:hypothetical protein
MSLRVRLRRTNRSDVLCATCNNFRAEYVIVRVDGTETDSGVHRGCANDVQLKFTRKRLAQ